MTGRKPDERIRTPMRWTADPPAAGFSTAEPWQPLSDDPPEVNVATQLADPDSLLRVYGDLVRVRSQQVALREGATTVVDSDVEPVIGWLRTTAGQTVLALVNVDDEPVDGYALTLARRAAVRRAGGDADRLGRRRRRRLVTPPTVNEDGGVDAWTPIARLAPRSGYLIALEPAP